MKFSCLMEILTWSLVAWWIRCLRLQQYHCAKWKVVSVLFWSFNLLPLLFNYTWVRHLQKGQTLRDSLPMFYAPSILFHAPSVLFHAPSIAETHGVDQTQQVIAQTWRQMFTVRSSKMTKTVFSSVTFFDLLCVLSKSNVMLEWELLLAVC